MPGRTFNFSRLFDPAPHAQWLSNGHYSVLFTAAGSGYSTCGGLALTRWRGDATVDGEGYFFYLRDRYLRDREDGAFGSATHQPAGQADPDYEAHFAPGRASVRGHQPGIDSILEVCVSPHEDLELRRLRLTNTGPGTRRLEVTSYLEAVLNTRDADAAHPAFSKLFLQTGVSRAGRCLVAQRRDRSASDPPASMAHWLAGADHEDVTFETDRARFLGRGHGPDAPLALSTDDPLTGTVGSVLDTALCLRIGIDLAPGETRELTFCLAAAGEPSAFDALVERYDSDTPARVGEAFEQAAALARSRLGEHGFAPADEGLLHELAGALLYRAPGTRHPRASGALPPGPGATGRWADVIDGRPLVVARDPNGDDRFLAWLRNARAFWEAAGLPVHVVVVADGNVGETGASGGIARWRVIDGKTVSPLEIGALYARADAFLDGALPARSVASTTSAPPVNKGLDPGTPGAEGPGDTPGEPLLFDNGYGGFSRDGREYVIRTGADPASRPPLAWSNVIANESLGCIVSEAGAACTWSQNSRENRITPWLNDPVTDPHAEALYLRDEQTGRFWSPTPGPAPDGGPGETRHGFGYTRFLRRSNGLAQEVTHFCAREDAVRFLRVKLRNTAGAKRRISLVQYQALVLGVDPRDTARFIVSDHDDASGALLAVNHENGEFAERVAFCAAVAPEDATRRFTADRTAFLGRNGRMSRPAALVAKQALDGRTGALLDPCLAWQITVEIGPGEAGDCAFLLGEARDRADAATTVARYATVEDVDRERARVDAFWSRTLGTVRIETPVPEIDLMVNGWLQYQNLSCRLWGRSATYQSGGAFGFRDQLQDTGALIWLNPGLTRRQILLHAAHQFPEGDVLHWWHPPTSKGIRTRFSDDLLWLPFITSHYIATTGERAVLDEPVGFRTARVLEPGEDEAFVFSGAADQTASLYEHCCLSIDRSLTRGAHGLPLMGSGDWNDGMNRVGREGRGESVWLGFFLYDILRSFTPLCRARGDEARVARYEDFAVRLRESLNEGGWDGAWYRRAYYDDGTPLGSSTNHECRIDAIAQAWSVISGAAPPERARLALDSLEEHLVDEAAGIIRLLTPAFDKTSKDPGYIKGYVPGVRENGGQYTHGVLWAIQALAESGRREQAARCLTMLSPVSHALDGAAADTYKVEPFVIAADVYGADPHTGRGGWTWYTGSAGWMFRVALESVLGLTVEAGEHLRVEPRVPNDWEGYSIRYRVPGSETTYRIEVTHLPGGAMAVKRAELDGESLPVEGDALLIPLVQDDREHLVRLELD
ncbi:MAG: glycosyl transferase [Pseudomonadota bacterium]|nr:glycosyl transferase [Pseudomonadota bacterium]